MMQLQVILTPGEGQTKMRVFGNFSRLAAVSLLPLAFFCLVQGVVIPLSAGVGVLGSAGIGLAAAMLVYLLARLGLSAYIGGKERTARQLLKRLEGMIPEAEAGPVQAAQATRQQEVQVPPSAEARVELPGAETAGEAEAVAEKRRRARS
jgi:hypothetical protein